MNDAGSSPRVCIIHPHPAAYSETFIRAHIDRLPGVVDVLTGGWFPTHDASGAPLFSRLRRLALRLLDAAPRASALTQSLRARWLAARLEAHRVDVVLAEYGPTAATCVDACRRAGVPLIAHFHGVDAYGTGMLTEFRSQYAELFGYGSGIIGVSRSMVAQLRRLGAPEGALVYLPCGVDVDAIPRADPARSEPRFVAVGRFVEKKAPESTLAAFAQVARLVLNARLVMVGDGPLLASARRLAHALGVSDAVEFTGAIGPEEVAVELARARAFVQHSVVADDGDSEGTPVAVLEAAAAGLPVIATRHGGIVDVIRDGEDGLLIEEGDVLGMADRMIRVALDPELAERLGASARRRIVSDFSVDDQIGDLAELIQRVGGA